MGSEKTGFSIFYRTPDGEECLPKLYFASKYGLITGLTASFLDIGIASFPQTIMGGVERVVHHTPMYVGMGAAYASTVCISAHIRKRNDFINHVLGGLAAGSMCGVKYESALRGGAFGAIFAVVLGGIKFCKDNNIPFMEKRTKKLNRYNPVLDFSIKFFEDPGRPLDP